MPAASLAQIADGFVCEGIEVPGGNIGLKLLIPRGGVEPGKPVAEGGEFLAGELADGGFDLVDAAHVRRINFSEFKASAEPPSEPNLSDRRARLDL